MNIEATQEKMTEVQALAIDMSQETIEASRAINNTLKTTGKVGVRFHAHYANAKLDVKGIMELVQKILRENQAVFPRGIEGTELRKIAVAGGMFTSDILAKVAEEFSEEGSRYLCNKGQAVKNVLSTYGRGIVGKIQLTNNEDQPRTCAKPRCKWYLIDQH